MTIDRDEKCAFCGFPRHAHWGGPQALVAGQCAGFESRAATRLNAAAPDMLEALIMALPYIETAELDEGYKPGVVAKVVKAMRAAIDSAEGR